MRATALAEGYLAHLKRRGVRPTALAASALALSRFFSHLRKERSRDIHGVREEHVISFLRRLATRKSERTGRLLAPSTQAAYLAVVHAFFAYLESRRLVLRNAARGVRLPKRERLPRALPQAQVRRLVSAPDAWTTHGRRDRALLELLYGTGLRLSECVRLDLQDLDLDSGTLLVRDGKGRKDRYVPLSGAAKKALDVYLCESRPLLDRARGPSGGALFLSRYGRRLGSVSVRTLVRRYGSAAGARASTHVLRHYVGLLTMSSRLEKQSSEGARRYMQTK